MNKVQIAQGCFMLANRLFKNYTSTLSKLKLSVLKFKRVKSKKVSTIENLHYKNNAGFTITELLIGIAVLGILTAIAVPNLNQFMVQMRVDNEISQIQRLVLTARNTAITMEQNTTLCPLMGNNSCGNNWQGELSVFIDLDNDNVYEPANNETLIKVKSAARAGDTLTYAGVARITFAPTGLLSGALNSTFRYCPAGFDTLSRAIVVSRTGRLYQSSDTDGDGRDETRDGVDVSCN